MKFDACHTGSLTAHGADLFFFEAQRLSGAGDEHDLVITIGQSGPPQFIFIIQGHGNEARGAHAGKFRQRYPLHAAGNGCHGQVGRVFKVRHSHRGCDAFVSAEGKYVHNGDATVSTVGIWDLVSFL
ncbi:hypothetical protein SDC9_65844 [bioreactor metagenome]|uniref:Uncharacterized protein n=1 Tax=bioreactor metagenome TaxID=1076179 RepID=A0A644XT81_9ZZZZ